MTDNAEAEKVHATVTSSGDSDEPLNGDQAQRPDFADEEDLADEEEAIDPDAVIIEEDAAPVPANDELDTDPDATPVPADELDRDPDTTASPTATGAHGRTVDETHPDPVPADVLAADAAAADVTPAAPASTGAARSGPGSTGAIPSGAVQSGVVPSSAAATGAVPTGAAPSGAVPGAARPGMPADADGPADTAIAGDAEQLHQRWAAIQSAFVDDPRGSVAAAAELTTETVSALVASAQQRERGLRGEWDRDGADTEDLRNTLRGYRSLLDQLAER
jgi:hypothetical protein